MNEINMQKLVNDLLGNNIDILEKLFNPTKLEVLIKNLSPDNYTQQKLFIDDNLKVFCEKYEIPFEKEFIIDTEENKCIFDGTNFIIDNKGINIVLDNDSSKRSTYNIFLPDFIIGIVLGTLKIKKNDLTPFIPKINEDYIYFEENGEKKSRTNTGSRFDEFLIKDKNCYKAHRDLFENQK